MFSSVEPILLLLLLCCELLVLYFGLVVTLNTYLGLREAETGDPRVFEKFYYIRSLLLGLF
jgi:hypothetical protein